MPTERSHLSPNSPLKVSDLRDRMAAWPNGKALLSGFSHAAWQRLWVRVPSPSYFILFFLESWMVCERERADRGTVGLREPGVLHERFLHWTKA